MNESGLPPEALVAVAAAIAGSPLAFLAWVTYASRRRAVPAATGRKADAGDAQTMQRPSGARGGDEAAAAVATPPAPPPVAPPAAPAHPGVPAPAWRSGTGAVLPPVRGAGCGEDAAGNAGESRAEGPAAPGTAVLGVRGRPDASSQDAGETVTHATDGAHQARGVARGDRRALVRVWVAAAAVTPDRHASAPAGPSPTHARAGRAALVRAWGASASAVGALAPAPGAPSATAEGARGGGAEASRQIPAVSVRPDREALARAFAHGSVPPPPVAVGGGAVRGAPGASAAGGDQGTASPDPPAAPRWADRERTAPVVGGMREVEAHPAGRVPETAGHAPRHPGRRGAGGDDGFGTTPAARRLARGGDPPVRDSGSQEASSTGGTPQAGLSAADGSGGPAPAAAGSAPVATVGSPRVATLPAPAGPGAGVTAPGAARASGDGPLPVAPRSPVYARSAGSRAPTVMRALAAAAVGDPVVARGLDHLEGAGHLARVGGDAGRELVHRLRSRRTHP